MGLWYLLCHVCSIHLSHWVIAVVLKVGLAHITDEQKGAILPKVTQLDVVLWHLRECESPEQWSDILFHPLCLQLCLGDLQHLICSKCFCVAVRPYCIGKKHETKSKSVHDRLSLFCIFWCVIEEPGAREVQLWARSCPGSLAWCPFLAVSHITLAISRCSANRW